MTNANILDRYCQYYHKQLLDNERILNLLKKNGIFEPYIIENFMLGYSNGSIVQMITKSDELADKSRQLGLVTNNKDTFSNFLIIPVFDENKTPVNIAGYNLYPQSKNKFILLNNSGIWGESYLKNCREVLFTNNPLQALGLVHNDYTNATFFIGSDAKYLNFCKDSKMQKAVFTFEGKERLFYDLARNGISSSRVIIDFSNLNNGNAKSYLEKCFNQENQEESSSDIITEIERGFLFQFPHLNYRVIGNTTEQTMNMKLNIKAYKDNDLFVDMVDLYKNKDKQSFIFSLMDKFNIRDQLQLENDLNQIMEVIEKRKEKAENEKKQQIPELTDFQKDIGLKFLKNPDLIDEIDNDITQLGYVREKKNKIVLYLAMTSRLMDNPLACEIVSRSSAGKSQILEIIETLCPPEDLVSLSDLSEQAFYYFGENDLKHKLVVIGEKMGSSSSDYPIRELISKKSISKAVPIKDNITGQIKTEKITVYGPCSFMETSTSNSLNEENLNRYFLLGVDESSEQTRLIHERQRESTTLEGYLEYKNLEKIIQKHVYAQRLLRRIKVFNPFARLLKFPANKLKTRRDHQKFLRLILIITYLYQYQRKVKKLKTDNNEVLEYIECTVNDYRTAYELLKDGILDNTLDDIPRQTKELLNIIRKYLQNKSDQDKIPVEKIIFTRKEIREHAGWTFAQVRNNFRTLKDYEYVQLLPTKNGMPHQYRLTVDYRDSSIDNYILTPEELEKRIREQKA